jgi:hypothetical protein
MQEEDHAAEAERLCSSSAANKKMKIEINIQKKHVVMMMVAMLLISALTFLTLVIATGYTDDQPFHETLFVDMITGKSDGLVTVNDNMKATGSIDTEDSLCIQGDCKEKWPGVEIIRWYFTDYNSYTNTFTAPIDGKALIIVKGWNTGGCAGTDTHQLTLNGNQVDYATTYIHPGHGHRQPMATLMATEDINKGENYDVGVIVQGTCNKIKDVSVYVLIFG